MCRLLAYVLYHQSLGMHDAVAAALTRKDDEEHRQNLIYVKRGRFFNFSKNPYVFHFVPVPGIGMNVICIKTAAN